MYWKLQLNGMIHRYWELKKTSDIKHNFPHLTAKRQQTCPAHSWVSKWQSRTPSLSLCQEVWSITHITAPLKGHLPQSHHRITLTGRLRQSDMTQHVSKTTHMPIPVNEIRGQLGSITHPWHTFQGFRHSHPWRWCASVIHPLCTMLWKSVVMPKLAHIWIS